jgi:hypothetical protein
MVIASFQDTVDGNTMRKRRKTGQSSRGRYMRRYQSYSGGAVYVVVSLMFWHWDRRVGIKD